MKRSDPARLEVRWCSPARGALVLVLLLSAALLGSCAEESSEDRRFANEPAPTEDRPTATVAAAEATEDVAPTVVQASPESLLEARGAPDRIYTGVGQTLWSIGAGGPRQLVLPSGTSILAFDGSPSGDRVAVAAVDGAGRVSLLILDAAGTALRTVKDIFAASGGGAATPTVAVAEEPAVFVDWGLQGDTILVGDSSGRLTAVPVEGEPWAIPIDVGGGRLLAAQISPRGDSVALLRHDRDGVARLVVLPLAAEQGTEARLIAPREGQEGRTVQRMAWLPDGGSLLYVEGSVANGATDVEGDLFSVRLAGLERTLVATGGEAGPAGTILDFQASPDGKSVAYVVGIPEGDGMSVHSVWIVSLRSPIEYQVPAEPSANITRLRWTQDGLIWGVKPANDTDGTSLAFYHVGQNGEPEALFTIRTGPAGATPMVGTPAARPAASPSPGATPAG